MVDVLQWPFLACLADMQETNWCNCIAVILTCNRNKALVVPHGHRKICKFNLSTFLLIISLMKTQCLMCGMGHDMA
jgi:hypothetical protein